MDSINRHDTLSQHGDTSSLRRRFLRQLAATGALAALWPGLAEALEGWEDGDPLCRLAYPQLPTPHGYGLDAAFFKSFIGLSEALTGVKPLDNNLAGELMDRYALHPQLSDTLKKLIDAYRTIAPGDTQPTDADLKKTFMPDPPLSDGAMTDGAKQLIYLWYVAAFDLPRADDPKARAWVYGTREQYRHALL